jgi:hypothetical protein
MTKTQEIVLPFPWSKTYEWAIFVVLIGIAPLFLHEQWIAGPMINALIVATTLRIGPKQALLLSIIPSVAALAAGILPFILVPTLPIIIIGNMLLVAGVQVLKTKPTLGVLLGASIKFIWLTIATEWIMKFFIPESILGNVTAMLSWPQFATALIGGFFVLGIMKLLKQ